MGISPCLLTMRTALSMSQSLKIMRGDFPPSSRETFFRLLSAQLQQGMTHLIKYQVTIINLWATAKFVRPYLFMICLPIGVEPVKPSFRMCGWSDRRCPTMPPREEKRFGELRLKTRRDNTNVTKVSLQLYTLIWQGQKIHNHTVILILNLKPLNINPLEEIVVETTALRWWRYSHTGKPLVWQLLQYALMLKDVQDWRISSPHSQCSPIPTPPMCFWWLAEPP